MRVTISGKPGCDAKIYQQKKVKKKNRGISIVKDSARYIKIVEWNEEDQCFVGQCPGVIGPCCHGDNETEVYDELCRIVENWLEIAIKENKELPPPTIGKNIARQLANTT